MNSENDGFVNLSRFEHDELLGKSAAFDELQAKCKQLKETCTQLRVQNEALQAKCKQLKETCTQLKETCTQLRVQNEALQKSILPQTREICIIS